MPFLGMYIIIWNVLASSAWFGSARISYHTSTLWQDLIRAASRTFSSWSLQRTIKSRALDGVIRTVKQVLSVQKRRLNGLGPTSGEKRLYTWNSSEQLPPCALKTADHNCLLQNFINCSYNLKWTLHFHHIYPDPPPPIKLANSDFCS